jgi:F-type H+-transporting ATPase subunit a
VFRKSRLIPGRLQSLFESVLGWLLNLCESAAGEKNGRRFFPVVATIFLFVLMNSWLSLLPFFNAIIVHTPEGDVPLFRGASTDANLTLALALVSFIFVTYFGINWQLNLSLEPSLTLGLLFTP